MFMKTALILSALVPAAAVSDIEADSCDDPSSGGFVDGIVLLQKEISVRSLDGDAASTNDTASEQVTDNASATENALGLKNDQSADLLEPTRANVFQTDIFEHGEGLISVPRAPGTSTWVDSLRFRGSTLRNEGTIKQLQGVKAALRHWFGVPDSEKTTLPDSEASLGSWLAGVLTAGLAALAMSSDDFLWLTPFLVKDGYMPWAVFYVFNMELIVVAAWIMVLSGNMAQDAAPTLPVVETLNLLSAFLLLFYTVVTFREWWLGEDEEEDSGSDGSGIESEPSTDCTESPTKVKQVDEPKVKVKKRDAYQFFTICVVGSIDNFGIYVSLLLANVFTGLQLFIGVLVNSILVVCICRGMTKVKAIVDFVNQIPLWVIVGALTIYAFATVVLA